MSNNYVTLDINNIFQHGNGLTYNYQNITPGNKVSLDDDLILWLVKTCDNMFAKHMKLTDKKMGAEQIGEKASSIVPGRKLPIMRFYLK